MRMSDLAGKEIIDLGEGVRLGAVREADLIIDPATGAIGGLVIPVRRAWAQRRELTVRWTQVVKIGVDVIIIDLSTPSGMPEGGIAPTRPGKLGEVTLHRQPGRESARGGNGHWGL